MALTGATIIQNLMTVINIEKDILEGLRGVPATGTGQYPHKYCLYNKWQVIKKYWVISLYQSLFSSIIYSAAWVPHS